MKAFPNKTGYEEAGRGMDLRDYFAAKALSIIAVQYPSTDVIGCAELAYEYADAMMKEREIK